MEKGAFEMTENEKAYFSAMYDKHSKVIYGICLMYTKCKEDAEEAVADAFVRLMENKPEFENDSHERAWLIRTSVNICKDMFKSSWRKNVIHDEDVLRYMTTNEERSILEDVLALPPKYRIIIYMHYYQGYTANEIADILKISQSAVLARLSRGRKKLKVILNEGGFYYA